MTIVERTVPDPFQAVQGWVQDYWMLRLLSPQGLDLLGPGGPCHRSLGHGKAKSRRASFANFAERLAALGWVIAWTPVHDGKAVLIAQHVDVWQVDLQPEVVGTRGLGGVALGLPPRLASLLHHRSLVHVPETDWHGWDLIVSTNWLPPRYLFYAQLHPDVLQVVEEMLVGADWWIVDLDEIVAAASAAVTR